MTCVNAAGAEEAAAAVNACGSVNVSIKASIFFSAILLAPSKFTLFELLSVEVPTSANSSILHNIQKKKKHFILENRIFIYRQLTIFQEKQRLGQIQTLTIYTNRKVKFDDQVDLEDCANVEQEKYWSF